MKCGLKSHSGSVRAQLRSTEKEQGRPVCKTSSGLLLAWCAGRRGSSSRGVPASSSLRCPRWIPASRATCQPDLRRRRGPPVHVSDMCTKRSAPPRLRARARMRGARRTWNATCAHRVLDAGAERPVVRLANDIVVHGDHYTHKNVRGYSLCTTGWSHCTSVDPLRWTGDD